MTTTSTPSTTTPTLDDERTDLLAELAAARFFLLHTVRGLSDKQVGSTPTVSELCLGGLVKHVAAVEDSWTRFILEGPTATPYDMPEGVTWADLMAGTAHTFPQWAIDRQQEFRMGPGDTLDAVIGEYERTAARTDRVVAEVADLSFTQPLPEVPWNEPGAVRSVRRVLIHLVAETSQHAGHADIIRETIDGQKSMG